MSDAPPDRFDQVHARLLRGFADLVAELGGTPERLMADVGLDPSLAATGGDGLTYGQAAALMERAAEALGAPDFGIRLARRQSGGDMFGPLGPVMRNSPTFGDAIRYVASHAYAHSLAARIWLRPEADGGTFVGHDILLQGAPRRGQLVEQILLAGHLEALEMTRGVARARRVHVRHQPLSCLRTYRRHFGRTPVFGADEDGVAFAARDLAAVIADPDAGAYRQATSYIDAVFAKAEPPLAARVRGLVMGRISSGRCRAEGIAAELGLHLRTLHRRLAAEGSSFRRIKDEVRRDIMLYYLGQTRLDFAYISEKLGFAEQSVMTRACRQWFGVSPTLLRAAARSPRSPARS